MTTSITNDQARVLLVDDDQSLCQLLSEYLAGDGFAVITAADGEQALQKLRESQSADVMVLDIMMPKISGLDVLKQLRQFSSLPVIMLTGRGDDIDRILGLEMGADDYLAKPCNPRELSARIKAVLRRTRTNGEPAASAKSVDGLTLDPSALNASLNGQPLGLTGAEFRVLQLLVEHLGQVLSKEFMTEQVLQRKLTRYDRSIDVHVSRVRQKLAQAQPAQEGFHIKAVRGMGYQFLTGTISDEN
jgi:DNA-binding response OmpR family regulator